MFLLVAVPIENRPRHIMAGSMETRRPQSSDTGAQQRGPKANPNLRIEYQHVCCLRQGRSGSQTHIYSEMHRTVTSFVAPVYFWMEGSAAEMMLEPKLAARASIPSWNVTQALYGVDQLRGLAASFSSQRTRNSSGFSLFVSAFTGRGFSSSTSTRIAGLVMVALSLGPRRPQTLSGKRAVPRTASRPASA